MIEIKVYQLLGLFHILGLSDDWMVLPHEGQTFLICSTDSHADLLPKCSTYVCARTHAHCFTSYLGSFHLVKPMHLNTPAQM